VITFNDVVMTNPVAVVDYTGSGTFVTCPVTLCPYQSYVGNVFTFNVTHWTNYSVSHSSTNVPEFGTWALLLALGIVAIGIMQRGRLSKR
jgi:hypothetical protein